MSRKTIFFIIISSIVISSVLSIYIGLWDDLDTKNEVVTEEQVVVKKEENKKEEVVTTEEEKKAESVEVSKKIEKDTDKKEEVKSKKEVIKKEVTGKIVKKDYNKTPIITPMMIGRTMMPMTTGYTEEWSIKVKYEDVSKTLDFDDDKLFEKYEKGDEVLLLVKETIENGKVKKVSILEIVE